MQDREKFAGKNKNRERVFNPPFAFSVILSVYPEQRRGAAKHL
jgi:hypothetical protein